MLSEHKKGIWTKAMLETEILNKQELKNKAVEIATAKFEEKKSELTLRDVTEALNSELTAKFYPAKTSQLLK